MVKDALGDTVPALDENGAIVRKPLTDDQYWEYIAKYAKDVPAVVDRLKTLEDNRVRGGKEGRVKGEAPRVGVKQTESTPAVSGSPARPSSSRPDPDSPYGDLFNT